MNEQRKSLAKIVILILAIGLILLVGIRIFLIKESPENNIKAVVEKLVTSFEERKKDDFMVLCDFPISILQRNGEAVWNREGLEDEFDRVYEILPYIDIQIVEQEVTIEGVGDVAVSRIKFHWSIASSLYPNARSTSKSINPKGEPDYVELNFLLINGEWKLKEIALELQSQ